MAIQKKATKEEEVNTGAGIPGAIWLKQVLTLTAVTWDAGNLNWVFDSAGARMDQECKPPAFKC